MRILCLNGWGGRLHDPLIRFLPTIDADVLCLQEVVHTPTSDKDWLTYRDGTLELKQRANFFRDVARALPDHIAIFCPAAQGDLWDGDRRLVSQWGLASFVRRTLPIIGQAQGFVHKIFSADGYGDHPRSRNAHVVRLHDFDRGRPVTIAHMHGLRDLEGKHDTPERARQARALLRLVQFVAEPDDPIVVCGDFNVLPGSETFDILGEPGLVDLVTMRGFKDTRTSFYEKPARLADYMLVNDRVGVERFDVIETPEVSDHRPLLLEM